MAAFTAIATIVSAASSVVGGLAASEKGKADAKIIRRETEIQERQSRKRAEAFRARQRSSFVSRGLELDTSPMLLAEETSLALTEDILAQRNIGLESARQAKIGGRQKLFSGALQGATKLTSLTMKDAATNEDSFFGGGSGGGVGKGQSSLSGVTPVLKPRRNAF